MPAATMKCNSAVSITSNVYMCMAKPVKTSVAKKAKQTTAVVLLLGLIMSMVLKSSQGIYQVTVAVMPIVRCFLCCL